MKLLHKNVFLSVHLMGLVTRPPPHSGSGAQLIKRQDNTTSPGKVNYCSSSYKGARPDTETASTRLASAPKAAGVINHVGVFGK